MRHWDVLLVATTPADYWVASELNAHFSVLLVDALDEGRFESLVFPSVDPVKLDRAEGSRPGATNFFAGPFLPVLRWHRRQGGGTARAVFDALGRRVHDPAMDLPRAAPRILHPHALPQWRKSQLEWLTALGVAHVPTRPALLHSGFSGVLWRGDTGDVTTRVVVSRGLADRAEPRSVQATDVEANQWAEMATVVESESGASVWIGTGRGQASVWEEDAALAGVGLTGYPVPRPGGEALGTPPRGPDGGARITGGWRYLRPRVLSLQPPAGLAGAVASWYDAPAVCRYAARKLSGKVSGTLFD